MQHFIISFITLFLFCVVSFICSKLKLKKYEHRVKLTILNRSSDVNYLQSEFLLLNIIKIVLIKHKQQQKLMSTESTDRLRYSQGRLWFNSKRISLNSFAVVSYNFHSHKQYQMVFFLFKNNNNLSRKRRRWKICTRTFNMQMH